MIAFVRTTCYDTSMLSSKNSVVLEGSVLLHQYLLKIRDPRTSLSDFRGGLMQIGKYLGERVLNQLEKTFVVIETLTKTQAEHWVCQTQPVLVTVLRAGLPLLAGVQEVFPEAEVGFFGISRDEKTLKTKMGYVALPEIEGKVVILVDTMLATGNSIVDAWDCLKGYRPLKIWIVSAIASQQGVSYLQEHCPDVSILVAALDPHLNDQGFILPGLGDAGDRSFGQLKFRQRS